MEEVAMEGKGRNNFGEALISSSTTEKKQRFI
jgi:hypothetical protein